MTTDIHFKKLIPFQYRGFTLTFRVSQDLFSSHDIDTGTRFLLRSLADERFDHFHTILDLGCGYGPLGLSLRKMTPQRTVHLVDRDALAVDYTRQNAELNGLVDVTIYGGLGYDDLRRRDFDLIVSNLPAKAGEPALRYFVREGASHLVPGGMLAFVVISPLAPVVTCILGETDGAQVLRRQERSSHVVFHVQFANRLIDGSDNGGTALERGVYQLCTTAIAYRGLSYTIDAAYDLPEADALSHATELLIEALQGAGRSTAGRAVVFNPCQGHIAIAVAQVAHPEHIALIDRDLLALRDTRRNLILNGLAQERISLSHQAGIRLLSEERAELIAGIVREDEGREAAAQMMRDAAAQLAPGGTIVAAGSSTAITRLTDMVQKERLLRVQTRLRRAGHSAFVLTCR